MAPPPELMDDVTAEILLRVPPDEPAHLFRAALVCKPWLRLLTDPAFLRRYRAFHRTPPLLGFLHDLVPIDDSRTLRFVPTAAASPLPQPAFAYWALDCRHGRVLLDMGVYSGNLAVWDPITGDLQRLRDHEMPFCLYFSSVVLCTVGSCNHLDCKGGPFLVVSLGSDDLAGIMRACVYSSESGAWGASATVDVGPNYFVDAKRGALIGDEIYFTLKLGAKILKYDLDKHCLFAIEPPDVYHGGAVLMPTEDSSLGFAGVRGSSLYLWSRKVNAKGIAGWVQCRIIELDKLFPDPCYQINVIGFAENVNVIFVSTYVGVFTVDLKSGQVKKVSDTGNYYAVAIPVMSFYTPDCASRKLPLLVEAN
ncbi:hypothetical protein ACP70R_015214 [Stipagrostis hirtigluma subsp. patula]